MRHACLGCCADSAQRISKGEGVEGGAEAGWAGAGGDCWGEGDVLEGVGRAANWSEA